MLGVLSNSGHERLEVELSCLSLLMALCSLYGYSVVYLNGSAANVLQPQDTSEKYSSCVNEIGKDSLRSVGTAKQGSGRNEKRSSLLSVSVAITSVFRC